MSLTRNVVIHFHLNLKFTLEISCGDEGDDIRQVRSRCKTTEQVRLPPYDCWQSPLPPPTPMVISLENLVKTTDNGIQRLFTAAQLWHWTWTSLAITLGGQLAGLLCRSHGGQTDNALGWPCGDVTCGRIASPSPAALQTRRREFRFQQPRGGEPVRRLRLLPYEARRRSKITTTPLHYLSTYRTTKLSNLATQLGTIPRTRVHDIV